MTARNHVVAAAMATALFGCGSPLNPDEATAVCMTNLRNVTGVPDVRLSEPRVGYDTFKTILIVTFHSVQWRDERGDSKDVPGTCTFVRTKAERGEVSDARWQIRIQLEGSAEQVRSYPQD